MLNMMLLVLCTYIQWKESKTGGNLTKVLHFEVRSFWKRKRVEREDRDLKISGFQCRNRKGHRTESMGKGPSVRFG